MNPDDDYSPTEYSDLDTREKIFFGFIVIIFDSAGALKKGMLAASVIVIITAIGTDYVPIEAAAFGGVGILVVWVVKHLIRTRIPR